jgi:GNAT superfamily N-acetyltransferase
MEVFLKIKRPLIIATKGFEGTFFDFAPSIDKDENYEDSKALIKFKEAFEDVCDDFDLSYDLKIRAWEEFMDNIGELDYVSAYKIIQAIKRIEFFYDYLANEELGGNNVYEFVSQIFQKLRFDGVIYLDASEHFPNMGIPPNTKHFVAFKPNQIKLADGTNTTFDSKNPDIRFDDGGLIYKKKKGNEKEHPHTEVYLGEKYIGYYMPNDSMFSAINENWNFVSKNTDYPNLRARTKNELISMINNINPDIRFNDGGGIGVDIKTPIYTAIFVNEYDLIYKYPSVHKNIFYHHSTIEFKPQDVTYFPKGQETKVDIIGRLTTDKVDVLLVNNPLSKKKNPHITLSTAEGVSPMQSDIEIEENLEKIIPLNDSINGVYDIFYGDNSKIISTDNGSNQVTLKYIKDGKELGYLNYIYDDKEPISVGLDLHPFNFNSEMYIDFIEVYKDYRGKGIAKRLLNKAISDAKKLGIDIITLRRDSGLGCNYGSDYDNILKKIYSSVGFIETWTEKDVNESGGEKNICAMHLLINKEKLDDGGQLESTVAERFNLPVPKNINDLEIGVDEIISQYANRKMASIQVQAYLNENKDLGLEFIKNHNLTNVHELNKYLNNRQSVLRRPILAERKAESNEFEKVKAEVNTDAIVKMAIEQNDEMEKSINSKDN